MNVRLGDGARIDPSARVEVRQLVLGARSVIGPDVLLRGERLVFGTDCELDRGARVQVADGEFGDNLLLFRHARVQAGTARIGSFGKLSRGAVVKAGRIEIGLEFWMNHDAEIGGGSWRNGAALRIGDRCHIGTGTHVNTAAEVRIGSDTAVGMHCVLATHAHWQPATLGHARKLASIVLGRDVAVYTGALLSPGVTVGDRAVVVGGAVVVADVPAATVVGGVPARVLGTVAEPADPREALTGIVFSLCRELAADADRLTVAADGCRLEVRDPATGTAVFDLVERTVSGPAGQLSERVRGLLFGHGIRPRYRDGYRRFPASIRALVDAGIEDR